MRELILLAVFFFLLAGIYKFRRRIFIALRRFDAGNAARAHEEFRDRYDRFAHYKHTRRLAEEEVEEVTPIVTPDERTGMKVTRYVFQGQPYATRGEAAAARREAVIEKARAFYIELDKVWLGRHAPHRGAGDAGPALPSPTKTDSKH